MYRSVVEDEEVETKQQPRYRDDSNSSLHLRIWRWHGNILLFAVSLISIALASFALGQAYTRLRYSRYDLASNIPGKRILSLPIIKGNI